MALDAEGRVRSSHDPLLGVGLPQTARSQGRQGGQLEHFFVLYKHIRIERKGQRTGSSSIECNLLAMASNLSDGLYRVLVGCVANK